MTTRPLRIMLDARLLPGQRGGVEQVVVGLMHAFARFGAGHEYIFLAYSGAESWLGRYLGGSVRLATVGPPPVIRPLPRGPLGRLVPLVKELRRLVRPIEREIEDEPAVVAGLQPDVIHFNLQTAFRTAHPNLYQPWDLQHVHYPDHFTRDDWRKRDYCYRHYCNQATRVMMTSEWGRRDVIEAYHVPPDRTCVVSMAPPVAAYPAVDDTATDSLLAQHSISGGYALYPAQTWPHKNHATLIDALARAQQRHGASIQLICTGRITEYHRVLAKQVEGANLSSQVRFLGFTNEATLLALYRRARLLVFPSLFEGWGLPITEAMLLGVPVLASSATCLPEQVGDAGMLFNPDDTDGLADALVRIWSDAALRQELIARGRNRVSLFTWERTAAELIATYEAVART